MIEQNVAGIMHLSRTSCPLEAFLRYFWGGGNPTINQMVGDRQQSNGSFSLRLELDDLHGLNAFR